MKEQEEPSWFELGDHVAQRYRLVGVVGTGGMGVVWRAEDERMGRTVAVKTLKQSGRRAEEAHRRFQREMRISAALRHPRIMVVHDTGNDRGFPFLVMELIGGRSLSQVLADEGPPSVPDAVLLLRRLAQAMSHAHSNGVLHRDIKPANILVDGQGSPKLCDFGIACHRDQNPESWETAKGLVVGTPAYLAPEAYHGQGRDFPVDFYAFGCVAFELLTGRRRSTFGVEPPAPSSLREGVPTPLDGLVTRLLSVDPAGRPGGADQIVALLSELASRRVRKGPGPDRIKAWRTEAEGYERQGAYVAASDLYRQIADGQESAAGDDTLASMRSRIQAARCLFRAGEHRAAEYEFEKVANAGERLNGKEHNLTLEALSGLAYCLSAAREHQYALRVYREVSEYRGALGPDGPKAVAARYDLARCRADLGDYEAAYRGFTEVAAKQDGLEQHLDSLCWAAWCLARLGRRSEALAEYRRLLPLCEKAGGTVLPWARWLTAEAARRPESAQRIRNLWPGGRRPPGDGRLGR